MRQIWIPRIGPPSVLEVREAPDPVPGVGEVRVRVEAAGVNFADVMARMGLYPDAPKLPAVIGYEISGTVDALGPGVVWPAVGARVVAPTRFGGYADVINLPATQVLAIPAGLSFAQAAAIPVNYLTAWLMLIHLGNLRAGERVLVHAAAGGVGLAALQIARWRGAEVIGTASASKHARLRDLGCAHCIAHDQDFEAEVARITDKAGVGIVIDAVGGGSFAKSYRSLAPLGRLFMFGASSFAPGKTRSLLAAARGFFALPSFKPIALMNENRGVFGVNVGHLWSETALLGRTLDEILALVTAGTFVPVVDSTYPFERAAEAHARLQDRGNVGKVVLVPR